MPVIALLVATAGAAVPACAQSVLPGGTQPAHSLPAKVASPSRLATAEPRRVLRDVTILRGKTSVEVHIKASGPVKPVAMVLSGPERIVVDLAGVGYNGSRRVSVNAGDVESVRVALFQADPPVTRVVVDLARPHEYRLLPAGSTVILAIDTRATPAVVAQPAVATVAAVAATIAASPQPAPPASNAQVPAPASEAKLQPPVAQPEVPTRPPPEAAPLRMTQPSEPTVSTALPQVATIAVSANPPELSGVAAGEEETTPHQAAKGNKPGMVRSVTVSREKDAIEVHIEGTKPLRAHSSTLGNPERIIIDLTDVRLKRPRHIAVNAADVQAVSAALFLVNPLVTRVVVDLARPHAYHLQASGNSLTVRIETDEVKTADSPPVR